MAAGYNINACTWLVASGPSQIERVVLEWFRGWVGYPQSAGGLFTSGGSAASLIALVAAREAAGGPDRATVYMSGHSHSAVIRAAMIIGVHRDRIRLLPSDDRYRLDVDALARAVEEDRAAGLNPIAVCANAGAGGTGAVDPLEEAVAFCAAERLWLHVDAAYGGFAVVTEEVKRLLRGMEQADSIGLDAHKWFFQPYEAGCLLVKDASKLTGPFSVHHDLLQDTIWGKDHPNFSDSGLQLSRAFRALKVWMSVQTFGMAAFRKAVSNGMNLAARAEDYIGASPVLAMANPASLGIVCFRIAPSGTDDETMLDEANRTVLARLFWEDRAFISSISLRGTFALRMCIINHNTSWDDVRETLAAIERFGREALAKAGNCRRLPLSSIRLARTARRCRSADTATPRASASCSATATDSRSTPTTRFGLGSRTTSTASSSTAATAAAIRWANGVRTISRTSSPTRTGSWPTSTAASGKNRRSAYSTPLPH